MSVLSKLCAAIAAAAVAIPVPIALSAPANAVDPFPCRWHVSELASITYTPVAAPYGTYVGNAASSWNSTGLGVHFGANSSAAEIAVIADYFANYEWNGLTSPTCTSGYFVAYSIVRINRSALATATANQRKQTVVHEFGHMLGLAHYNYWSSCSNVAMMNTDPAPAWDCGLYDPQSIDVANVYNLYY